jgi:hypothetical protein
VACLDIMLDERKDLFKIIRDKDLEIEEYRNSGVKLSRPSLKTAWFRPEDFDQRPLPAPSGIHQHQTRSSIETLSSSECNALLQKAQACKPSSDAVDSRMEVSTQTGAETFREDAEETGSLRLPEPTHKRKVDKPDVKVTKKTAAQKKLMKL